MADWSQLPVELLSSIAERFIHFQFNLLRFRSVCSSWRSSFPFSHYPVPSKFPILSNDSPSHDWTFSLSKRTLFLLNPPPALSIANPHPWLFKIQQHVRAGTITMDLFDPLSRYPIKSLPLDFPKLLDVYDLPIVELGQEYVLNDINFRSVNPSDDASSLYLEKVVFTWLNPKFEEFVLLTIHVSGKLAFFKSGDKEWTIIPDMPTPYDDVCVFQGKLYAVDNTGRTVVVGLDSSVSMVAEAVYGGDKKLLVESNGELLLVDKHLSYDYQSLGIYDAFDDEVLGFGCEKAVKFDIYKLNEGGNEWVELKSLGDRVLMFGDDCAFSASASELSMSKGNCIIFRDDFFDDDVKEDGVGVFHLDDDRISPISDCPGYSKLFWPPPDWLRLLRLRLLSLSISEVIYGK
ncbi:F-box protein SKIP23 [Senna tora]|uniref:F-box protein SKIP23 n=1 Tax=Senna tora TaxID=362788 RepID=A0A834T492_9FABA|nr:F-box protein SKIP23 [Senna tora]